MKTSNVTPTFLSHLSLATLVTFCTLQPSYTLAAESENPSKGASANRSASIDAKEIMSSVGVDVGEFMEATSEAINSKNLRILSLKISIASLRILQDEMRFVQKIGDSTEGAGVASVAVKVGLGLASASAASIGTYAGSQWALSYIGDVIQFPMEAGYSRGALAYSKLNPNAFRTAVLNPAQGVTISSGEARRWRLMNYVWRPSPYLPSSIKFLAPINGMVNLSWRLIAQSPKLVGFIVGGGVAVAGFAGGSYLVMTKETYAGLVAITAGTIALMTQQLAELEAQ